MVTRVLRSVDAALDEADWPPLSTGERGALAREIEQQQADGRQPSAAILVAQVLKRRQDATPTPRRVDVPDDPWRWQALSDIAAIDAGERDDVRHFRSAHLPELLDARQDGAVPAWITAHADKEVGDDVPGRTVAYADRDVPVTAGGVLDALAVLTSNLARVYGWGREQATAFVLTGARPLVSGASIGLEWNSERPMADRVVIRAHPMLPASAVMALYLDARAWYAEHRPGLPRPVPVREHAAKLAVFVSEAFAAATFPPDVRTRDEQWLALKEARPDLPTLWKRHATYRRLRAKGGVRRTYARPSDWWKDAIAAVEHLVFLRPVGQPGRTRRSNGRR